MVDLSIPAFQGDADALAKLTLQQREAFEAWMKELDAEHAKAGYPYGEQSLWKATGVECWLGYFNDGYEPDYAMSEDMSQASD